MKIWVLGSRGMLGSTLLASCQKRGIEAIGTHRQEVDLCCLDALVAKALEIRPTHIVNCAAYTDVDGAQSNRSIAFAVNAQGSECAALAAKACGSRLIHLSTDYVFNGQGSKPYREGDACAPINVYGESKWEGEKKILALLPHACIVRTSWVFGLKGKNFISALPILFQKKEVLEAASDQWSKPTYCPDLVEAIFSLLDVEGVVHFAGGTELSRAQIAFSFLEAMQTRGISVKCQKILPVLSAQFATIAPRPFYSVLDTERYVQLTSLKPRSWEQTLNEYLNEVLAQ